MTEIKVFGGRERIRLLLTFLDLLWPWIATLTSLLCPQCFRRIAECAEGPRLRLVRTQTVPGRIAVIFNALCLF